MKHHLLALLLLTGISTNVFSQFDSGKADSIFKHYFNDSVFMGNVLLAKDGKIVYINSFGYSDTEKKTPHTKNSIFYLASLAKPITASAIFMLEKQSKLNTNDDIQKYIPTFPTYGITIKQLLAHTSGFGDAVKLIKAYGDSTKSNTNADILSIVVNRKPKLTNKPGTVWEYSDINYILLACLIEKISGEKYEQYVQHNFLNKSNSNLKLHSIDPAYSQQFSCVGRYTLVDSTLQKSNELVSNNYVKLISNCYGDGGYYGTIRDLYNWSESIDGLTAQFNPATFNDSSYVKTSWGSNVAYGWDTDINSAMGINGNKGAQFQGNMGVIFKFPETGITMIVLSNIETDEFWIIGAKVFECLK